LAPRELWAQPQEPCDLAWIGEVITTPADEALAGRDAVDREYERTIANVNPEASTRPDDARFTMSLETSQDSHSAAVPSAHRGQDFGRYATLHYSFPGVVCIHHLEGSHQASAPANIRITTAISDACSLEKPL